MKLPAVCVAVLAAAAVALADAPSFDAPVTVNSPIRANHTVLGDFNGDGFQDVAVLDAQGTQNMGLFTGHANVFFGNGSGGFAATPENISISASSSQFNGMASAPVFGHTVNSHIQADLIFAVGSNVLVFEWNGSAFQQLASIGLSATSIIATKVAVGNVTGGGHQDIVVSDDFGDEGIVVIPNNGAGTFGAPVKYAAGGCDTYADPIVKDLNGDGFDDVILSHNLIINNAFAGRVGVLLNKGDGSFNAEVNYAYSGQPGFIAHGVAVADVDDDGKDDLVVMGNVGNNPQTFYLGVSVGAGNGTFAGGVLFPFADAGGVNITARPVVAAADFNGDGRAEVVTLTHSSGPQANQAAVTVTRFTGEDASLALEGQDDFFTGSLSYDSLALGGLDSDTKPDIVAGTASQLFDNGSFRSQFIVFKNTSATGRVLPPGREVDFGDITFSGAEGSTITVPVVRGPESTGRVLVIFNLSGTAVPYYDGIKGAYDYKITAPLNQTLLFEDGQSEADITIQVPKSSASEPNETIVLTLFDQAVGAADIGPNRVATISLIDGKPSVLKKPAAPAIKPTNTVKGNTKALGVVAIGRTGSDWNFTVTEPVAAGAKDQQVVVQAATDPDNGPWTEVKPLTRSGSKWTGLTRNPPIASKVYFRTHVTATGFATVDSAPSKPYCVVAGPELSLNLTAKSDSSSGGRSTHENEVITYTFQVDNVGHGDATNVTLTVPIPEHTTFLTNTFHAGDVKFLTNKSGKKTAITWTFANLAANGRVFEDLLVQVDGPEAFSAKDPNAGFGYLITAGKTKKVPGFLFYALDQGIKAANQTVTSFTTEILGPIDLTVLSDASTNVHPGDVITYTLQANNSSPNSQTSVVIQDHIPPGTVLQNVYAYVDSANSNFNSSSQPLANPGPFSNPQIIYTRNALAGTIDLSAITNPIVLVLAQNLLKDKPGKEYDFIALRAEAQAKGGTAALPVFDDAVAALVAAQVVIPVAIHWNIPGIAAHTAVTENFQVRVLYDLDKLPKTSGVTQVVNDNYDFIVPGSLKKPLSALYGHAPEPLAVPVLPTSPIIPPGDNSPVIGLTKYAVGDQQLADPSQSGNGQVAIAGFGDVITAVQGRGFDYEVHYFNTGHAPARDVVIHDEVPATEADAVLTGFFMQSESGGAFHEMNANQITFYDKAGNILPNVDGTSITKVRSMDFRLSAVNALTPLAAGQFGIIRYTVQAKAKPAAPGKPFTTLHSFGFYDPKLRYSDPKQGAYIRSADLAVAQPAHPDDVPVIVVANISFDRHYNLPQSRQWHPNDKVEVDFDFTQNGDIAAANTNVKLVIPTGTTLLTAGNDAPAYTDGTQGTISVSTSGQNATLGFGTVEGHGTRRFKIFLQINSPLDPLLASRGRAYFDTDPVISWVPVIPTLAAARHKVDAATPDQTSFTEKQAIRVAQPTAARLGLTRSAPYTVGRGGVYTYTITFANVGDTAATNVNLGMQIPFGTVYVKTEAGYGSSASGPFAGNGFTFKDRTPQQKRDTGNSPDIVTWHFSTLPPHSTGKINLSVQVISGFADECVKDHSLYISADNAALVALAPNPLGTWVIGKPFEPSRWEILACFCEHLNIPINAQTRPALTDYVNQLTGVSRVHAFAGLDGITLNNSATVYAIGGGQALVIATGLLTENGAGLIGSDQAGIISNDGGSIVSRDGAGVISHDGGTLVVMGAASAITITNIKGTSSLLGDKTAAELLADPAQVIAAGAGNILRGGIENLLTDQGAGIKAVSNIDGSFFTPPTALAPSTAGVISAGAGNLLAPAGGACIAAGAGNVLHTSPLAPQDDAITLVPAGGSVIAAGAGNVVSHDGGTIVSNDGNSLIGHDSGS